MKEYQRFSSLQHHLDLGKHERALEHATLLDRAVIGYADRLQEQSSGIPQIQQVRKHLNPSNLPCLPMGWALKCSHVKRTRFTEEQRDYLSRKFRIGQTTGQKAGAASVSKSMMTASDNNGRRLYTSAEFLTSQQVSSFFQDCPQSANLETVKGRIVTLKKTRMQKTRKPFASYGVKFFKRLPLLIQSAMTVMTSANLLQIQRLQKICEHFDIPITDIKVKRKAPYIERLIAFGKKRKTFQGYV